MKISLVWLKDYLNVNLPAEKLAHRLTMSGLEVEKIESVAGDTVLELEITPNRPDCLNLLGIARELSAVLNKTLRYPRARRIKIPAKKANISILDKAGCPRYIGALIRGVNVTAAPEGMVKRLQAVGLRAVNNIVDITNFCLFETGQPLHAFDYDKLIGGRIVVRRARAGETIVTIDGATRTLDPSILVIADAQRPVAIAGIMGGRDTEVTASTKNVFLESACFDPVLIRRAGRKLGLSTDSSYRFERGVDLLNVETASRRAMILIQDLAGGDIAERQDFFAGKRKLTPRQVVVKKQQVDALLGAVIPAARCKTILKKLEFNVRVEQGRVLKVTPPPFRGDIRQEVDVIEEIARVIGYDNLPLTLPSVKISNVPGACRWDFKNALRRILTAQGCYEAVSLTMLSEDQLRKARLPLGTRVKNPLTQEQEFMRSGLLPSLLSAVQVNFNRGQKDLRIFEIGKRYLSHQPEEEVLGLVYAGRGAVDWRLNKRSEVDFYDIKGAVESLLEPSRKKSEVKFLPADGTCYVAGKSARVVINGQESGFLGEIRPEILRAWDIKHEKIFFAEIALAALEEKTPSVVKYQTVAEYPAVTRDISLAVPAHVAFSDIRAVIHEQGKELLAAVHFIEEYRGEKIPAGCRGMVFSLVYQSPARTLTEDEVSRVHERVVHSLTQRFSVVLR